MLPQMVQQAPTRFNAPYSDPLTLLVLGASVPRPNKIRIDFGSLRSALHFELGQYHVALSTPLIVLPNGLVFFM
jgi:hypothetical protein